jgi:hypothetical protein
MLKTFSQHVRSIKNKVGNNLPEPIRQRIASAVMFGRSGYEKNIGHHDTAKKAWGEAGKLLRGIGRIPPPSRKNKD